MNELGPTAIELTGIGKVYRLYRKRAYRLLDLFGLCPGSSRFFTEHAALESVNLTIGRGEKVAIIGRNGAGKSTLLKIITGAVKPTTGDVRVDGKVSALLQIGTGFHPDFTGRQNAYSSLALQGLTGRAADAKFEEIVEFAELEQYIDQPMKTFSTGMCARLMFSASVVIAPDVLIVDEILGVGDAYFSHKSFERMREICTSQGTTLLLVTHDVYSALKLCDRFIWLDRGCVKFDGEGKTVISLYESSIKEQEETSLRQRNIVHLDRKRAAPARVHVLFRSRTGFALPAPLALEHLQLTYEDGGSQDLEVAEGASDWSLLPESNLGAPQDLDGRRCREIVTAGSIYHKAEWSVTVDPSRSLSGLRVRWRYAADQPVDVRVFADVRHVLIKDEIVGENGWQDSTFPIAEGAGELDAPTQQSFGTGQIRIRSVECLDRDHRPLTRARHGEALCVRFTLDVSDQFDRPEVTFVLGFNRPGLPYGCYAAAERMALAAGRSVQLDINLDPLLLGSGTWMMTYAIGEADLYGQKEPMPYFTVNDRWYHFVARGSELEVESVSGLDASACFTVHPSRITTVAVSAVDVGEKTKASGV